MNYKTHIRIDAWVGMSADTQAEAERRSEDLIEDLITDWPYGIDVSDTRIIGSEKLPDDYGVERADTADVR